MARKKSQRSSRNTRFILRIKSLPTDAKQIDQLPDGTTIHVDKFGTVYAQRLETVTYRLLQGTL